MKALLYRNIVILVYVLLLPLVGLSQRAGDLDRSFNYGRGENYGFNYGYGANREVDCTAIQPDGKIIIVGDFSNYNGISRNKIARLNSDGNLDNTFNVGTGTNDQIRDIALQQNGKVVIVGDFTTYNGTVINGVARLNSDGSLDASFNPGTGANDIITSVALQTDGKIIIGGWFTSFNSTTRNRIARLNTNGSLDTSFNVGAGANDRVSSTTLLPNGKIVVVGDFITFNGTPRNRIARLNTNGSLDTSFNIGNRANSGITTFAQKISGKIIIGGYFTTFDGVSRNRLACLNTDGSLDTNFRVGLGTNVPVTSIAIDLNDKILISGSFVTYNGIINNRIARLNVDGTLDTSFRSGTGIKGSVTTKVLTSNLQDDGKIILGGEFSSYDGTNRFQLVRLNPNGTIDLGFSPVTGADHYVLSIAAQSDGKILIGGSFSYYNGYPRNKIARLNSDGSLDTSFKVGSGFDSFVEKITIQTDGKIIVGGNFTSYNDTTRYKLTRLNADGSLDISFNIGGGFNLNVQDVVVQSDGKIIVAGDFTNFNGTIRNRIARLNANGSLDALFNPSSGANGKINSINQQLDGKIIIAGNFTTYNGTVRNRVARLNATGSLDASFNPSSGASGVINSSILQTDGKLVIAGSFNTFNGVLRNCIARLNNDGSLDNTFIQALGDFSIITSLGLQADGKIVYGTSSNPNPRTRLARLNSNGSIDTSFNIGIGIGERLPYVTSAAIQSDGQILIGGDFTSYNGFSTPGIARIHDNNCPPPALITVTGNRNLCNGEPTTLTSSSLTSNLWSTGDTTRSINISQAGSYYVRIVSSGCTSSASDTIRVRINEVTTPTISGDTSVCAGTTTRLTSSSPTSNLWSTGDTTQFINVAQAGSYSVRVISGVCTSAVSAPFSVVNAGPSPTVINFDTTSSRCLGARLQLTPAGTFAHYQWNTGERTRSIYTRTSGQYSVQVAYSDSCFGLPSPPIFIAFDTNWCSVEIFRVGLDSITANVWADYYIWYLDGIELLSSNTLKTIPIQGNGVYTVRAIIDGRTSPMSNPIVITSGKKSINAPKLQLYPNPTTGIVTLTTSPDAESIAITNAVGQLVFTSKAQPEMELNLNHLSKGVYMVQVQSNKGVSTQRLVIQ